MVASAFRAAIKGENMKRAVIVFGLAAMLGSGCTTVATHYRIKGDYEAQARRSLERGGRALVTVGDTGVVKEVTQVGFWERVRAEWLSYAQALGVDIMTGVAVYLWADSREDDRPATVYNITNEAADTSDATATTATSSAAAGE
jgi:cytosine/adenosine deaminase-related metal-dependent hydrolase